MRYSLRTLLIVLALGSAAATLLWRVQTALSVRAAHNRLTYIAGAIDLYAKHVGTLPPDLKSLVICPPSVSTSRNWAGPYFDTGYPGQYQSGVLLDPWGRPFRYSVLNPDRRTFRVWSDGPDRASETADDIGCKL